MHKAKLFRHWRRQYRHLFERQERLLELSRECGAPEHIHDLRVTLRRLRLMVRVSTPLLDRSAAQSYRRWSRQISNTTSRLRDFDVTLEWLASQNTNPALRKALASRRRRLWLARRHRFLPPPPKTFAGLQKLTTGKRAQQRLAQRYPARFARLHARVVTEIPHFFEFTERERHAFRRTIRLLRYLRELALTDREREQDSLLKALARPQAAMGEYQNIVLARQIIGTVRTPAPVSGLDHALAAAQSRWQAEITRSLRHLARIYRAQLRAGILPHL
jgi:CHAD domain-containing protein